MASPSESPYTRSAFYVGGEYVKTTAGHLFQHQMYVEKLTPSLGSTQPYPVIFIHGAAQNGSNWLNKPDGGRGWASWFLDHGYEVYIVDQPHIARSPWRPGSNLPFVTFSAEIIQQRFTAPANYLLWPQARLHTQFPGTGMMGDPTFDAYYVALGPTLNNSSEQERTMQHAGITLLEKIGSSIIIAHSQGSLGGWSWTDARPKLVKALVQLEPKGPPFRESIFSNALLRPWGLTSIPLTYDPPTSNQLEPLVMAAIEPGTPEREQTILQVEPAKRLVNLRTMPILIVTAEASYHSVYDHCFIEFLAQAGCKDVKHLELSKAGIHGNGHMMFMEKNSDEIAVKIEEWICHKVTSTLRAEQEL